MVFFLNTKKNNKYVSKQNKNIFYVEIQKKKLNYFRVDFILIIIISIISVN